LGQSSTANRSGPLGFVTDEYKQPSNPPQSVLRHAMAVWRKRDI